MDTSAIQKIVRRLARPHGRDSVIVEGTAVRAAGSDFDAIEGWIMGNGGVKEAVPEPPAKGGLYGDRFAASDAHRNLRTVRYILPASALTAAPQPDPEAAVAPAVDGPPAADVPND